MEIDEFAINLLATQQVVAADLRLVVAALKINTDLERMGDLSVSIAQRAVSLLSEPMIKPMVDIRHMSSLVESMVRKSLDAFVANDADMARSVLASDDAVDSLRTASYHELVSFMEKDPQQYPAGARSDRDYQEPGADRGPLHQHRRGCDVPGERDRRPASRGSTPIARPLVYDCGGDPHGSIRLKEYPALRHFAVELEELNQALLEMGALVESSIHCSVQALVDRDERMALRVMEDEKRINQMELDIDARVTRLLALNQPVAGDLRLLIMALKINTDLERMGDLASNMAERAITLSKVPAVKPLIDTPRMASLVEDMLHRSLDAFVKRDAALAAEVLPADDEVDSLRDKIYSELLEIMQLNPTRGPRRHSPHVRGAEPGAHRRSHHQYRRGRHLPGARRRRPPPRHRKQSLTGTGDCLRFRKTKVAPVRISSPKSAGCPSSGKRGHLLVFAPPLALLKLGGVPFSLLNADFHPSG